MSWMPTSGVEMALARASILDKARQYFASQNVLEVFTPALSSTGVTDPNIDSVPAMLGDRTVYLHTSPEFMMKRLIAAGFEDIYQVCRVFRDGESGPLHQPEFTMIEWYRLDFNLTDIIADCIDLVTEMLAADGVRQPRIVSYSDIFAETLSIDPMTASPDRLADLLEADAQLRASIGEDRDAWLNLAMATLVAPHFADNGLTVIFHYPASQASLARLCPEEPTVAERFELYLGSVELANGFVELTDPDVQLQRFENERQLRAARGKPVVAIDDDLINALRSGLPPCAGVALGLDRLLMIAEGQDDIANVMTFLPGGRRDR
jgi:lysyl-tRNA synthetase class 2